MSKGRANASGKQLNDAKAGTRPSSEGRVQGPLKIPQNYKLTPAGPKFGNTRTSGRRGS